MIAELMSRHTIAPLIQLSQLTAPKVAPDCKQCKWYRSRIGLSGTCRNPQSDYYYVENARRHEFPACGASGKLFEPKPPNALQRLRNYLVGEAAAKAEPTPDPYYECNPALFAENPPPPHGWR